jgi:hypothetical protein
MKRATQQLQKKVVSVVSVVCGTYYILKEIRKCTSKGGGSIV